MQTCPCGNQDKKTILSETCLNARYFCLKCRTYFAKKVAKSQCPCGGMGVLLLTTRNYYHFFCKKCKTYFAKGVKNGKTIKTLSRKLRLL